MKLYLAGPDVFRPDVVEWMAMARAMCRRYGHEPLTPMDHDETDATKIFAANIALLQQADILLANLNPFRGLEPDSGTCVELGYALALGKPVYGYVAQRETLKARINRAESADTARPRDNHGMAIENFDLPLNLMLAIPAQIVEGDLEACIQAIHGAQERQA